MIRLPFRQSPTTRSAAGRHSCCGSERDNGTVFQVGRDQDSGVAKNQTVERTLSSAPPPPVRLSQGPSRPTSGSIAGQGARPTLVLLFCAALSLAQTPPPLDSRNTDIPDTDTHFYPKAFWRHASHGTLDQWEERKRFLRGQILSAAGLDPMPDKTPLHPRFMARVERGDYSIENV